MFINVFIRHYHFICPQIVTLGPQRICGSKDNKLVNERSMS